MAQPVRPVIVADRGATIGADVEEEQIAGAVVSAAQERKRSTRHLGSELDAKAGAPEPGRFDIAIADFSLVVNLSTEPRRAGVAAGPNFARKRVEGDHRRVPQRPAVEVELKPEHATVVVGVTRADASLERMMAIDGGCDERRKVGF